MAPHTAWIADQLPTVEVFLADVAQHK